MVFNTRSDTEKTVENTTCRQVVLTKFEGFDILMKQILYIIHMENELRAKKRN